MQPIHRELLPPLTKMLRDDTYWMEKAYLLAQHAQAQQEIPVGAVLVVADKIVGSGWNQSITRHDPTAHAEILALRDAGERLHNYRFNHSTLYVTLEPCMMCIGALIHARIQRLVFAARDPKTGAVASQFHLLDQGQKVNHRIDWEGGVLAEPCSTLLKDFFLERRA
jgi:tRNA(adenine34) deaminase